VQPLYAAVAAAIGVSTSPAVLMLVAQEMRAEGQVTERALNLAAINSVVAFVSLTMLLSWIHHEYRAGLVTIALHPIYILGGSLILGYAACMTALLLSRWLGKRAQSHYVLLLALIVVTVGAARMLELSVLLALLAFGVMARNLDARHDLMTVDLGRIGQLFFVVLFVISGAMMEVGALVTGGGLALVYILARFAGKSIGVLSLTYFSGVRTGSAGLLCIALTPMSVLALAMVQGTVKLYPEFGAGLSAIVLSAVLILELVGPVAVQYALKQAGESGEEA
jgi:NhaP-type Na+/H+ or K+/H+ antiporter